MSIQRTLSIIKPDGIKNNIIGKIINCFEEKDLKIIAARMKKLNHFEAKGFYNIHKQKIFFKELINFMCSGPIMLMVLEGENAISENRKIMGSTNPANANKGTIRKRFSKSITENTVHGSDTMENAKFEINWFFALSEIC